MIIMGHSKGTLLEALVNYKFEPWNPLESDVLLFFFLGYFYYVIMKRIIFAFPLLRLECGIFERLIFAVDQTQGTPVLYK